MIYREHYSHTFELYESRGAVQVLPHRCSDYLKYYRIVGVFLLLF